MELKVTSAAEFSERRTILAGRLNQFRDMIKPNSVHSKIKFEIAKHMTDSQNPLNIDPAVKMNRDIYHDLLEYALDHYPTTLEEMLGCYTDRNRSITGLDISRFGMLLNQLIVNTACKVQYCSSMLKVKTVTTRNDGLTRAGLDGLARVRVTQGHSASTRMRSEHASLALQMYSKYGSLGPSFQAMDNAVISQSGKQHHYVQGYTGFEIDSRCQLLNSSNEKTLKERLDFFKVKTLDLEHLINFQLKQSLDGLAFHCVGRLLGASEEDFKWFLKHFPAIHDHPNKATAGQVSYVMKNPTIPLNEAENNSMVKILEEVQNMFLSTVATRADDPEACQADIDTMKSREASKEERKAAENRVMKEVKKHGELFIHGDLATVEAIKKAFKLRKTAKTLFEKLVFIKIARSGTLHLVMNKTIQDFRARMLLDRSVEDKLSLANIQLVVGVDITNDEDKIKNSFELHRQVEEAIADQAIIAAFREHKKDLQTPEIKNKLAAENLISEFLEKFQIRYFAKMPKENNIEMLPPLCPFYDDLEENTVDLASRGLLSKMVRVAEKNGDGQGLRAVKFALIPYFLNKKNVQDSKYALYLLDEHVDFQGLSDRDKARVDQYSSINTSGNCPLLWIILYQSFLYSQVLLVKTRAVMEPMSTSF